MLGKYVQRVAIFTVCTALSLGGGSCVYRWTDDHLQVADWGYEGRLVDSGVSRTVGVVNGLFVGAGVWMTWPLYRLIRKGELDEERKRF